MIEFFARMTIDETTGAAAVNSLRRLIEPTRVLPGCDACMLLHDDDEPRQVTLMQRWSDETALVRHLRSRDFRPVLAALDASTAPPEVRFDWVERSEGLAFLRSACADLHEREPFP